MNKITALLKLRHATLYALGVVLLSAIHIHTFAQQPPPRPISVSFNPAQGLRFGAFYQSSSGGTVTVDPSGSRTSTGAVVLATLTFAYGPANFQIVAAPGTLINIVNGPDATLTGSTGGSMTMHIGTSLPASPFVTTANPPSYNNVYIGGTLTVGSPVANPSGSYSGSFYVTFMQE